MENRRVLIKQRVRGNILEYGEQTSINFDPEDFPNFDSVLRHCFNYFNTIDELYIYELILPDNKIYNRKRIEKLWGDYIS